MSDLYRTTHLPGATLTVFHQPDQRQATVTIGTTHQEAIVTFSLFMTPADLERLAAELLAAAQLVDLAQRRVA